MPALVLGHTSRSGGRHLFLGNLVEAVFGCVDDPDRLPHSFFPTPSEDVFGAYVPLFNNSVYVLEQDREVRNPIHQIPKSFLAHKTTPFVISTSSAGTSKTITKRNS